MNEQYKEFVRYGEILSDKNFDIEGNHIRMTVFNYENEKYLTIRRNGECVHIEKIKA